jgi:hypothetical protein
MSQVTISPEALAELRKRSAHAAGVMIFGPMRTYDHVANDAEEARHLEIAYGEAPRWVMRILLSKKELEQFTANAHFRALDIEGLRIVVSGAKSNVSLRVELVGDSIRISEQ